MIAKVANYTLRLANKSAAEAEARDARKRDVFTTNTTLDVEKGEESVGEEDDENIVTAPGATLASSSAPSKRMIRRMERTPRRAIAAEILARKTLENTKPSASSAEEASEKRVVAGVLSLSGTADIMAMMATRETLAIALATLKETKDEHSRAR